jgi:dTDP-glucose pyrophosphorylase
MKAIILAAGIGRRLQPLTEIMPKPMLPINGHPIIKQTLKVLSEHNISQVMIVTGYQQKKLRNFIDSVNCYNLEVKYIDQGEPRGTGDALLKARKFIDTRVIILAADTLFSAEHISGIQKFHEETGSDATLCLKRVSQKSISRTSSVKLTNTGRITEIIEKPKAEQAPSNLAAALLHIYEPIVVDYLSKISISDRGEYELTDAIKMMIDDGRAISGKEFTTPPDMTDINDFLRLNFPYMNGYLSS